MSAAAISRPAPAVARGTQVLWVAFALALVWFSIIGMRTLTEPDEGRYAEIPREMLATGDWVAPHLNGFQYLEKPPLQYWATAAFYAVLGVEPWVSRLWTTVLGFLGLGLVWYAEARLLTPAGRGLGALILASSPLYFVLGHLNTLDMALAVLLTGGLVGFLCAQRAESGSKLQRHAMWLTWLALALATLQKGLVALALPAFALVLYSLAQRDLRLWRRLQLTSGLALVLAVNLPWWVAMARRNPEFLQFFFMHEHFTRFTTTEHHRAQPWWYLAAILIAGVLPWLHLIARGLVSGWRAPAQASGWHPERFLVVWAAAVFLFYAPSGSKLAPYILPMLPALALLAARELQRPSAANTLRILAPSIASAAALALTLLAAAALAPRLVEPGVKRAMFVDISAWVAPGAVAILVGTVAALLLARRGARAAAATALGLALTAGLALLLCGTNALERERGGPALAQRIAPQLAANTRLYCVGLYLQAVPFALHRTCVSVEYHGELEIQFGEDGGSYIATLEQFAAQWREPGPAVAVIAPHLWPHLQAAAIPARILAEEPYAIVIGKPNARGEMGDPVRATRP